MAANRDNPIGLPSIMRSPFMNHSGGVDVFTYNAA
jgi:hypothetical protein